MSTAIPGTSRDAIAARRAVERERFERERRAFKTLALIDFLVAGILLGIAISTGGWWLVIVVIILMAAVIIIDRAMVKRHVSLSSQIDRDESDLDAAQLDEVISGGMTVTVVMPAFNAEKTVGTAIESLKRQSYPRWECIVVDDYSSDETAAAALRAADGDPRITVVRLLVNSGPSGARNAGLAAASGDYLVYLDADDVLLSDALRNRVLTMIKNPEVTGSMGRQSQVSDATGWKSMPTVRRAKSPQNINISTAGGDQPFIPLQVMMKRTAARDLAGFNESMKNNEDFDYWIRSLRSGHEFLYSGYLDSLYVQLPDSIVGRGVEEHGRLFMQVLNAEWDGRLSGFRASCGDDLDGPLGEVLRAGIAEMRYLRFAGMMIGEGKDPTDVKARLADIDPQRRPLPPVFALSELQYGIRREYRRAGAGADDDERLDEVALVKAREAAPMFIPERQFDVIAPDEQPTWAVVATSLPEAEAVIHALENVPRDLLPMFVTTDSWLGDEGAHAFLTSHQPPVAVTSLPAFFLQGVVYQTIVIMTANLWVQETVSGIAAKRGSRVVLADPGQESQVMRDSAAPMGHVQRVRVYETLDSAPVVVEPSAGGSSEIGRRA